MGDSTRVGREAEFSKLLDELFMQRVRLGLMLVFGFFPTVLVLDRFAQPDRAAELIPHHVVSLLAYTALSALGYTAFGRRHVRGLAYLQALGIGAYVEGIILRSGPSTSGYVTGLILVLVTNAVLYPFSAREMAALAVGYVLMYAAPALSIDASQHSEAFVLHSYFMLNGAATSTFAAWLISTGRRRDFDLRRDLEERSEELALAQKVALVGNLGASLAHEIRNPVNAIVNGVPAIRRKLGGSGAPAEPLFQIVESAARQIVRTVDDLLTFDRRDSGRLEGEWSPAHGINETLRLLHHRLGDVKVHLDVDFGGVIAGHPERLNRVLMNVLDNAVRAMRAEGELWISGSEVAGGLELVVRDSGPGIRPEHLPRVFDPFFTTREGGQGTGLGLHLCRRIVESHGGTIAAGNAPNGGAEFRISLPAVRRAA